MQLSDHDLRQLDEARLDGLSDAALRELSKRLLGDLKEARERLNQTPENSSRPPSTRAPWERGGTTEPEASAGVAAKSEPSGDVTAAPEGSEAKPAAASEADTTSANAAKSKPKGRPGRRVGAPGASRTQVLHVDTEARHAPAACACCGGALTPGEARAYTVRYELELELTGEGQAGLLLRQTKHVYCECVCACGHRTREAPGRCPPEPGWTIDLQEWHLIGPQLASFIAALSLRLGGSYRRIQEFLRDWFGLSLSTALLSRCRHELGRALAPVVEEALRETLTEAEFVHVDETGWPQHDQALWLWVFATTSAVFYLVGRRTRELLRSVLGERATQWIMSDGYAVYRRYEQRLRCWAHILRKARGLAESLDTRTQGVGEQVLRTFEVLIEAVYAARAAPSPPDLRQQQGARLDQLWRVCVRVANGDYPDKARALARELLNDWDTYWVVLEHPHLPLTNNEAERALRHWVILRRVSQGTRTAQGSQAFAVLASVIDTCRQRGISPWPYLAEALRQRRKGLPAPPLPQPA